MQGFQEVERVKGVSCTEHKARVETVLNENRAQICKVFLFQALKTLLEFLAEDLLCQRNILLALLMFKLKLLFLLFKLVNAALYLLTGAPSRLILLQVSDLSL